MKSRGKGKVIDLRKKRAGAAPTAELLFPPSRKSPLRAQRRKMRALAVAAAVIFIALAGMGASALSYLPEYSVNDVSVVGANSISPKIVRLFVESELNDGKYPLISRRNIFLYPKDRIERGVVSRFPRVLSAEVSRESLLAQTVIVAITERQPLALWCATDYECFLMDSTGFIFAPLEVEPKASISSDAKPLTGFAQAATSTPDPGPIFKGGIASGSSPISQTFLPEHFSGILELFTKLREAGYAPVGAEVLESPDFAVSFSEGFVLRASFGADASALVRNLQLALGAEPLRGKVDKIEYIDLRFGNRIYYKNR